MYLLDTFLIHKGVSPILATILVVLVVISLSGAFLVYSQRAGTYREESVVRVAKEYGMDLVLCTRRVFSH